MVQSAATSVRAYIDELPAERQAAIRKVRAVVRKHLPAGLKEGMQYGMIGWFVPLSRYPLTYNGEPLNFAALASQKQYMSLYLHHIYADAELARWFQAECERSGKKLNMGKSCVRFKRLEDLPLEVIGKAIAKTSLQDFLRLYERARQSTKKGK